MAASHVAVSTGGKSRRRFRISLSATASGMGALLHHFEQIAERGGFRALGVNEKYGRASRAFARRFVDNLEAAVLQIIERLFDIGDMQRDARHAAAAAGLLDLFGRGSFLRQPL